MVLARVKIGLEFLFMTMQADLQAEFCRSRELAEEKKPRVSFGVILNESLAFEIYAEKM